MLSFFLKKKFYNPGRSGSHGSWSNPAKVFVVARPMPPRLPSNPRTRMTTTMMRLRQHLASPIYTSAIARIGNRAHHHRLPIAPPQKLRPSTASTTHNKLLLLLILLLVVVFFFFFLIPTVLLPPDRTMSSSSSSSSSASDAAASTPFEKPRAVVKKLLAESQPEGQGATVRRSIGRYPPIPLPSFCSSAIN